MSGQTRQSPRGAETIRGTVKAVNFAPKGEIDGLLIDVDGEVIQVNIPPDYPVGSVDQVGQVVELTVGPEPKVADHPQGDHRVHKLEAPEAKAGHKPRHHAGPGEPAEVSGTIERLNYAKHGEANGVVLETGDFVHLKPDGLKKAGLQVGQSITVKGNARPSETGGRAIEAESVNGQSIGPKKPH